MLDNDFHLLEELDKISKVQVLDEENFDQILVSFASRILPSLSLERMNVWLFNSEKTALVSIGEYDTRTKIFAKNSILEQSDFPVYFEGLKKNKIIIAEDIYNHPLTAEFSEIYSKPNDIYSLLDIPLRISGELVGVVCFEKTGTFKSFTVTEQSFCFSFSFMLNSVIENKHRRIAQEKLENALLEKEMLMNEMTHRIKNNFSILIALLRLTKDKVQTKEAQDTLADFEHRVYSMARVYDLLNNKRNYSDINLSEYIKGLVKEFCVSYPEIKLCNQSEIQQLNYELPSKLIVNLGLVLSEILMNSIKHSAPITKNYLLKVELKEIAPNKVYLMVGDNGKGFDFGKEMNKSLGLSLISDLTESFTTNFKFPEEGSSCYYFEIDVKP